MGAAIFAARSVEEDVDFNFLFLPTLVLALLLFAVGLKSPSFIRSKAGRLVWLLVSAVAAVPALLFVIYYGHLLDDAAWFYAFRATPYSELSAAGIGLIAGSIVGLLQRKTWPKRSMGRALISTGVAVFGLGVLFVPYAKPVITPIKVPLHDQWSQGVCLQSSSSTCGPCSAATLLKQFGINVSERDLAQECFSSRGGTENWYVARALQKHGLATHYLITSPSPAKLPFPSIAGVQMGGARWGGHFITILGRQGNCYIIGDPLVGRLILTPEELVTRYYFTGFFLLVSRPSSQSKAL